MDVYFAIENDILSKNIFINFNELKDKINEEKEVEQDSSTANSSPNTIMDKIRLLAIYYLHSNSPMNESQYEELCGVIKSQHMEQQQAKKNDNSPLNVDAIMKYIKQYKVLCGLKNSNKKKKILLLHHQLLLVKIMLIIVLLLLKFLKI